MMTVFGTNAPSLLMVLSRDTILDLHPRAIQLINTLALLANAAIVSFCGLSLVVIWQALRKKQAWAFWTLLVTMGFAPVLSAN